MRKFRANFLLYLLSGILRKIIIFGWIPLVLIHSSIWGQEIIRGMMTKKGFFDLINVDDSFRPFFKEPYEKLVVVLNDGRCLILSERNEIAVRVCARQLNNLLKKLGYKMEDVEIIIHNHFRVPRFTTQDKRVCRELVRYGFQGKFLVYVSSCNKTIEYKYGKGKEVVKDKDI